MPESAVPSLLRLACRRDVVVRALQVALVVGAVLIAINQGDVLWSGKVDARTTWKIALTPVVPYLVSTFSSVSAIRALYRARES